MYHQLSDLDQVTIDALTQDEFQSLLGQYLMEDQDHALLVGVEALWLRNGSPKANVKYGVRASGLKTLADISKVSMAPVCIEWEEDFTSVIASLSSETLLIFNHEIHVVVDRKTNQCVAHSGMLPVEQLDLIITIMVQLSQTDERYFQSMTIRANPIYAMYVDLKEELNGRTK